MRTRSRAAEHLAAYATAYRYPSPSARIKPAPRADEVASDAAAVETLLLEAASRFGVDLAGVGTAAKRATPIR